MRLKSDDDADRLAAELKILKAQAADPAYVKECQDKFGGMFSLTDEEQKAIMAYCAHVVDKTVSYQAGKKLFGERAALICLGAAFITTLVAKHGDAVPEIAAVRQALRRELKLKEDDGGRKD